MPRIVNSRTRSDLAQRLRAWRLAADITQGEAALLAAVTANTWARWERADSYPANDYLPVLEALLCNGHQAARELVAEYRAMVLRSAYSRALGILGRRPR